MSLPKFNSEYQTERGGSSNSLAYILIHERSTCDVSRRRLSRHGSKDVDEHNEELSHKLSKSLFETQGGLN